MRFAISVVTAVIGLATFGAAIPPPGPENIACCTDSACDNCASSPGEPYTDCDECEYAGYGYCCAA